MNIMMDPEIDTDRGEDQNWFTGRVRVRVTTKFGTMLFDRMFETKAEAQAAYDLARAFQSAGAEVI